MSLTISADDIVGILIHNANQAASVLGVHGLNTNWAELATHLARMQQLAAYAAAQVEQLRAAQTSEVPN